MWLNVLHPANAQVLRHFGQQAAPMIATADSVADPYRWAGSHPDVVKRVWDELGAVFAQDCRCLLFGSPALVLPVCGVVIAVCYGTAYAIRLPEGAMTRALADGATTRVRWTYGEVAETDIQTEFGPNWVFGCYSNRELDWCKSVDLEFGEISLG